MCFIYNRFCHSNKFNQVTLNKYILRYLAYLSINTCIRSEWLTVTIITQLLSLVLAVHIMFDDALELNDNDKWQVNPFVLQLTESLQEACR